MYPICEEDGTYIAWVAVGLDDLSPDTRKAILRDAQLKVQTNLEETVSKRLRAKGGRVENTQIFCFIRWEEHTDEET